MKMRYDQEVDILNIIFSDSLVEESDEEIPGMIFDYDINGKMIGIEILNASKVIDKPQSVEYAVAI